MIKTISKNFIYNAVFYSLLMHILVTLFLTLNKNPSVPVKTTKTTIQLELLEDFTKHNNTKKIKSFKDKTIVDQDKINDEIDSEAKYLSSHNQKVVKETVAQQHGQFQNLKQMKKKQKESIIAKENSHLQNNEKLKSKTLPLKQDIFGSYKYSLEKVMQKQAEIQAQKKSNEGESSNAEASQTRDYLPGKEAGLETLLSTREFVYYTYYNRIRNQLSEYWEPKIKEKIMSLFKQGRRIASTEDHITKLQIILDDKGLLVKVQILGASGVRDLDDVAVEAFRAAAPFPNPPKGIIESDGTVKIQWDFVVES